VFQIPELQPTPLARIKLGSLLVATLALAALSLTPDPSTPLEPPPGATGDREVFERIVARVRAGDRFHDATQEELRSHGYPTRSVFNWRTPCYAWLLGSFPSGAWGRYLLMGVSLTVLGLVLFDLLRDVGFIGSAIGGTLFIGTTAWCFSDTSYLFTELWAGAAIGLSICAFRRGWVALGVASGLFALFYRELALPYVFVSLGLALWGKRKRESIAWVVGIALFVAFMAMHASVVAGRLTPVDQALEGGWLRFGGARFLLATSRMNVFLMGVPLVWTAIVLCLAVFGLTDARDETRRRVGYTLLLFLIAFSVVGAPFNYYWGFLIAPLLSIALAGAPRALRRAWDEAALAGWYRSATSSLERGASSPA
jgi:hypothetical protein